MQNLTLRLEQILDRARDSGRVTVEDLAAHFSVTPQTIRRDLNELCEQRLLKRVHGGAVLATGIENVKYEARRILASEEKQRIARRAAELIPDNCSLFINIGTTTEEVARALSGHRGLMAITNNINVVNILYTQPEIETIVTGGVLRHSDGGIVGEQATDFIRQFKVDYAVIGASAIEEEGDLLDYDYREVRVSQAIIENARTVFLVVDHMKFSRSAPVRIGHISQVDRLITDEMPPAGLRRICEESGVRVDTAQ
ncbi:DeoR/GlpR family DNA-binding transcription regulator [Fodinicurvata halophila]|uniref:DeoR/GlpR family DNA-binding transcription regulator n=1 Tax=Fodinicurvata halophila TaxID=1419723 RepID=A0ABV8UR14_9PROT